MAPINAVASASGAHESAAAQAPTSAVMPQDGVSARLAAPELLLDSLPTLPLPPELFLAPLPALPPSPELLLESLAPLPPAPDAMRQRAEDAADHRWRERFATHAIPAALPAQPSLPIPADYAVEARPLPQIGKNPWNAISKDDDVKDHLKFIAETADRIGLAYRRIIDSYFRYKRGIVSQRHAITTTLRLADDYIGDVLATRAAHADIQPIRPVPAPATPTYETPEQLTKRFDQITAGAGQALARAFVSGGHPVHFAMAIAITVAASTISFQKTVRKMAASDAQLHQYALHVASQAAILTHAIHEIAGFSAELHRTDTELHGLLDGLAERAVWRRYCDGTCDTDEKRRADRLLSLAMMAKTYAVMGD